MWFFHNVWRFRRVSIQEGVAFLNLHLTDLASFLITSASHSLAVV